MKELINTIGENIQAHGYQCIKVKDYEDFNVKLNCMGGSYKGFIMTEHFENFCLFFIDTEKMNNEAYARYNGLPQYRFRMTPEAKQYTDSLPETFARKCIEGDYQREYTIRYEETLNKEKPHSFAARIKKFFKR